MTDDDRMIVTLTAYGRPATQGSKTRTKFGMRDDNAATLKPWRDAVRTTAADLRVSAGRGPAVGPVGVSLIFTLRKPTTAPKRRRVWPIGARSGDIDKMARAVLDALTDSGTWGDDAQVVSLLAVKGYVGDVGMLDAPGALIYVWRISDGA